ncbi:MAG: hypothetical protein K1060chlam3_00179 [Candidatus Anoxychlamydiales bacterium]|nr:hypothetical protein [Candidatus Anoxychlamydiales bacterium]
MSAPISNKNDVNDVIDIFIKYISDKPRDLFRGLNNIFFGNKHLIGRETKAIGKGLKNFSRAADIFSIADLFASMNTIRNHFNKKKSAEDIPMLVSDTANSVAESTAWLSTTGILSLSAYASSWVTSMSGITLMISFSKRSYQSFSELKEINKKEPENVKQKKKAMFNLVKNISFFAMGVLLFTSGWFGFALNIAALTIVSTSAIISSFATFYLENKKEDDKKTENRIPLEPDRVSAPTDSIANTRT